MPAGRRGSPVRTSAPGPATIISQGNFAGIDQGVDFRGRGPVPATDEAVVTDVGESPIVEGGTYPFIVYRLLGGPKRGRRVYVAENVRPTVRVGQHVQAGETVGLARGSYPYIEEGWNKTDTGWNPSAPYAGHGATSQGRDFWNYLRSKMSGGREGGTASRESLEQLWLQAGGPANVARIMAAIAVAESGGRVNAKHRDANGTTDYGLWQINSSHGYNVKELTTDPAYNAQAAVAVYRSQGLTAWSTYTSGAYRSHLGQDPTVPVASRPPRPGSAGSGRPGKGGTQEDAAAKAAGEATKAQEAAWASYVTEGDPSGSAGGGTAGAQPAFFGIPGTPNIPSIPGLPGIPGLGGGGPFGGSWNPLSIFNEAEHAVSDVGTFLKWIAWLFHPRNILRIVEFTAGGVLLVVGLRFLLEGLRSTDEQKARSLSAKKRIVTSAVKATPPGREASLALATVKGRGAARRARRHGRMQAQGDAERARAKKAQKRARQPGETRAAHKQRRRGGDVPF